MKVFPQNVIVCVGTIVLKDRKVLFVRQTYGNLKGKWGIPWGYAFTPETNNHLDPPHVAALRETREEAGIEAEIDGLLGLQNHQDPETGTQCLYILFLCHHVCGEPTPDQFETDRAEYFSLEGLRAVKENVDDFCYWLAINVLREKYQIIPPKKENPYKPHLAFL
jgi:ADP-ribose pyrophosphatase YjhB (NUDIX family)